MRAYICGEFRVEGEGGVAGEVGWAGGRMRCGGARVNNGRKILIGVWGISKYLLGGRRESFFPLISFSII